MRTVAPNDLLSDPLPCRCATHGYHPSKKRFTAFATFDFHAHGVVPAAALELPRPKRLDVGPVEAKTSVRRARDDLYLFSQRLSGRHPRGQRRHKALEIAGATTRASDLKGGCGYDLVISTSQTSFVRISSSILAVPSRTTTSSCRSGGEYAVARSRVKASTLRCAP